MDRLEALLNEDSDEDSDEGRGMTNSYSVEDLLGELCSDDDDKAAVTQPPLSACHSNNVPSAMLMQSQCSEEIEACASNDSQLLSVSDDTEGVSSHACEQLPTGVAPQLTSSVDSADQLTQSLNDADENCSPSELETTCLDRPVLIDGNYDRIYDEVLNENIYQNPFEEHEGDMLFSFILLFKYNTNSNNTSSCLCEVFVVDQVHVLPCSAI